MMIREYLLKFESVGRPPSRFFPLLDDPSGEWDDRFYKSIIVSCLKIILNRDNKENQLAPFEDVRSYLKEIEKTTADMNKVYLLLDEFMCYFNLIEKSLLSNLSDSQDNVEVHFHQLRLITSLMVATCGTDVIRNEFQEYASYKKQSSIQMQKSISKAQESFKKSISPIIESRKSISETSNAPKNNGTQKYKTKKEQLSDLSAREAILRSSKQKKIEKARRIHQYNLERYNPRTAPLGIDFFGNVYWKFVTRSIEDTDNHWGNCIIVEKNPYLTDMFESPRSRKHKQELSETQEKVSNTGLKKYLNQPICPGNGELFYLSITSDNLSQLISWLNYQKKLYISHISGAKKSPLLHTLCISNPQNFEELYTSLNEIFNTYRSLGYI